jgi:flagellar motility protein MotE (MotC chaperone)
MKVLLKYWYIILTAILLSIGVAVGMLFLRKESWMPIPVDPLAEAREKSPITNMSESYLVWNFELLKLDELRQQLNNERAAVENERQELTMLRKQVDLEIAEMMNLRTAINQLRDSVRSEFSKIEASEEANLRNLARVYTEMKPVPVVEIFKEMDIELVVKIMSVMPSETAARILEQMANDRSDKEIIKNAVNITERLRRIQK